MTRTVQRSLFDAPRPVEPADPNVTPEARPRLTRQAREILEYLRGHQFRTNVGLAGITHRFGARLYDLRRAGCVIRCEQDHATGMARYYLEHEPEGLS
jgi:hypothetical protein